jgi:hypothetical protein
MWMGVLWLDEMDVQWLARATSAISLFQNHESIDSWIEMPPVEGIRSNMHD